MTTLFTNMTGLDDLDFLQGLLDEPEPVKTPRAKKKKDTRDTDTWFKLQHIHSRCLDCGEVNCVEKGHTEGELSFETACMLCKSTNVRLTGLCAQGDECLGLTLDIPKGPERVTAIVNDVEMCRIDFLDGLAKIDD